MQTSVIIAIILGVLLLTAVITIIVLFVVGKKDLKNDYKTLLEYILGKDFFPLIPEPGPFVPPEPGDDDYDVTDPSGEKANAARDKLTKEIRSGVSSVDAGCAADVFVDNFSVEQQITILGIISTMLDLGSSFMKVKLPQNITNILNTYSLNIGSDKFGVVFADTCKCSSVCGGSLLAPFIPTAVSLAYKFLSDSEGESLQNMLSSLTGGISPEYA